MNRFFAPLILALIAIPLKAQQAFDPPRLIVGITIDQLRSDYIGMISHLFGSKGFNRLMKEGVVYEQMTFDYPGVSRASAVATIYTGADPSLHGVTANTSFNLSDKSVKPTLYDPKQLGNFTTQTLSPNFLQVSTIADELKTATLGKSRIYSVAPEADVAIIAAGHAGDAAFWLDDESGKWATTTYFRDLPIYITEFNIRDGLESRIDTMVWNPLLKAKDYTGIPYDTPDFLFSYTFNKSGKDKFRNFKHTPLVNREVTRIAEEFITKGWIGIQSIPDFLNVGYYGGNYPGHSAQEYGAELQDSYIRLDKEIASLLDCIDKNVGLQNTLVFLTSTGYTKSEGKPYGMYGIPTGEFFPKRSTALLNYYLMALYGQEEWVLGYNDGEIYLNRELIEKKGLNIDDFIVKSAEFLSQMEGVQDVLTSRQILHGDLSFVAAFRRKYHRKFSGDLVLTIQPGWEINYEDKDDTRDYVHYNAIPATLIFFGKNITPAHVATPVSAKQIAPAVSKAIRIRAPSASSSMPLPGIK